MSVLVHIVSEGWSLCGLGGSPSLREGLKWIPKSLLSGYPGKLDTVTCERCKTAFVGMMPRIDMIRISEATARALTKIGLGDFQKVETPEVMAFVVLVLRELEDTPERFPAGKWATIQHLEEQLHACAAMVARRLERSPQG